MYVSSNDESGTEVTETTRDDLRIEHSVEPESRDDTESDQSGDSEELARLAKEPTLIAFYVGLWWPLGLSPVARFTLIRDGNIPWADGVNWPEWFHLLNPESANDFVVASFHRHEHVREFDGRIGLYAMDLAENLVQEIQSVFQDEKVLPSAERATSQEDRIYDYGNVTPPASNTPATIVELMTPLFDDPVGGLAPVSFAFNRCLEELNLVETAYLLTTRDVRVRNTTRATCFPLVPFVVIDAETGVLRFRSHPMVNFGLGVMPYDVEDLDQEGMYALNVHILQIKQESGLRRYLERATIARRSREIDGDLASAILHLYTAGEVLLDTLLLYLAWEEAAFNAPGSLSEEEVAKWFSGNSSLRGRSATKYHTRLRGGWDLAEPTKPLYDWFGFVSDLRNRTVHSGYVPKEWEVVAADDILTNLENCIKDLLCDDSNRLRYPRTALMIVAIPGFERRGLLTRRIIELLQTENVDWGLSFRDWRRGVEARISR